VELLRSRLVIEESLAEVSGRALFSPTKSHAVRRIPLAPTLRAALEARPKEVDPSPDALLFPAAGGGPLVHSNFYHRVWRPALRAAHVPHVGVHALRHSAAAALIASGASPKAVQTILGHGSAAYTLTVYGHMFDADLDDVAARLDATLAERVGVHLASTASVLELPGRDMAPDRGI
jgi:integrase